MALISIAVLLHRHNCFSANHSEVRPIPGKMQESLTMRLSKLYLDAMNRMIDSGLYGSKSEIVREALRLFFEKHGEKLWEPE